MFILKYCQKQFTNLKLVANFLLLQLASYNCGTQHSVHRTLMQPQPKPGLGVYNLRQQTQKLRLLAF